MTCAMPACEATALGAGHWPFLCAPHGLLLATDDRTAALEAHEAIHRAFKAHNRHLDDLAPRRALRAAEDHREAPDPDLIAAALLTMQMLGAAPLRTGPRYGPREPGRARTRYSPTDPCAVCGSTRSARALFGMGDGRQTLFACTAADGCYARLRKSKTLKETA